MSGVLVVRPVDGLQVGRPLFDAVDVAIQSGKVVEKLWRLSSEKITSLLMDGSFT